MKFKIEDPTRRIQILKIIKVFSKIIRHVESDILKSKNLTSHSNSVTSETFGYKFLASKYFSNFNPPYSLHHLDF